MGELGLSLSHPRSWGGALSVQTSDSAAQFSVKPLRGAYGEARESRSYLLSTRTFFQVLSGVSGLQASWWGPFQEWGK